MSNINQYIYPFVKEPGALPVGSPIYNALERLVSGGKLSAGTDDGWDGFRHKDEAGNYIQKPGYDRALNDYLLFCEINHPETYQQGIYRLAGYIFNFRPFFKRFLVKTKFYGWREHYAPNKTFIRKCSGFPRAFLKSRCVWNFEQKYGQASRFFAGILGGFQGKTTQHG